MNETPTDVPTSETKKRKKMPQRGIRRRVLGKGEGDYCIYELAGKGSNLPAGAMIPIPGVPQFEDTNKAIRWIKTESGDLLAGKQVMIFRACEIMSLVLQHKPTVVIQSKPKVDVTVPDGASEGIEETKSRG